MNTLIPNVPQTHSEIFKTTYNFAKTSFSRTVGLYVLLFISAIALQLSAIWINISYQNNNIGNIIVASLLAVAFWVFAYIILGAIIYRMHSIAKLTDPGFKGCLEKGSQKFFTLLGVGIILFLAVFAGTVLLVIPGIIVGIYLIFSIFLIYSDHGVVDSLKESYHLVKNNWWRTFFNILLLVLVTGLVGFSIWFMSDVIEGLLLYFSDNSIIVLIFTLLNIIIFSVIQIVIDIFAMAFMLTCLYDLQIRKAKSEAITQ